MRRIARVAGRSDDMLIIRGVNVFPSQIEAILSGETRLAPCYLLEIRRRGRLDELTVKVETRTVEAAEANGGDIGRHAERLIKDHVGVSATVVVVPPGTIERAQGKARRVVDLRPAS